MIRSVCIFVLALTVVLAPGARAVWDEVPTWAYELVAEKISDFPSLGRPPSERHKSFFESGIDPSTLSLGSPITSYLVSDEVIEQSLDSEIDIISSAWPSTYMFPVLNDGVYIGHVTIVARKDAGWPPTAVLAEERGAGSLIFGISASQQGEFATISGPGIGQFLLRRVDGQVGVVPLMGHTASAMGVELPTMTSQSFMPLDDAMQRIRVRLLGHRRISDRLAALPDSGESRVATPIEIAVYNAMLDAARKRRVEGLEVSGAIRVRPDARGDTYIYMMDDRIPPEFESAFSTFITNSVNSIDLSAVESDSVLVVEPSRDQSSGCSVMLSPIGFDDDQTRAVAFISAYCADLRREQRFVLCLEWQEDRWEPTDFARLSSMTWGDIGLSN